MPLLVVREVLLLLLEWTMAGRVPTPSKTNMKCATGRVYLDVFPMLEDGAGPYGSHHTEKKSEGR